MNDYDFMRQQQAAVERMREMNSRAAAGGQSMPPVPPFVKLQGKPESRPEPKPEQHARPHPAPQPVPLIPKFAEKLKTDGDLTLILGLLLLLLGEGADKKLLFALIYILL